MLTDYLDELIHLAQRTEMDQQTQHTKIIESMLENVNQPEIRKKIFKFLSTAQDGHWDAARLWHQFVIKIKTWQKLQSLDLYAITSEASAETSNINMLELAENVQKIKWAENSSVNVVEPFKSTYTTY